MHPAIQRIRYYYRAYKRLELMDKAASLSFYTLISIFPMVLLLAALLGLDISVIGKMSAYGGFMLIAFLVFCLAITILPTRRLHPRRVALGALLFAVTVQIGKFGFTKQSVV